MVSKWTEVGIAGNEGTVIFKYRHVKRRGFQHELKKPRWMGVGQGCVRKIIGGKGVRCQGESDEKEEYERQRQVFDHEWMHSFVL